MGNIFLKNQYTALFSIHGSLLQFLKFSKIVLLVSPPYNIEPNFRKTYKAFENKLSLMFGRPNRHDLAVQFAKIMAQKHFLQVSVREKLLQNISIKIMDSWNLKNLLQAKVRFKETAVCVGIKARELGCLNCSDWICRRFQVFDIFSIPRKYPQQIIFSHY